MSESQPSLLDVNVPMYAAGGEHPHKTPCAWVMQEIAAGRLEAAIDTEIIQEVLYRYGTLRRWQIGIAIARDLLTIVPHIFPVTDEVVRTAIALFDEHGPRGVAARDVIHVAVMRSHGLTQIISTDAHFDQFKGILRLDPQDIFQKSSTEG